LKSLHEIVAALARDILRFGLGLGPPE